jgi:hypothetical protein
MRNLIHVEELGSVRTQSYVSFFIFEMAQDSQILQV